MHGGARRDAPENMTCARPLGEDGSGARRACVTNVPLEQLA